MRMSHSRNHSSGEEGGRKCNGTKDTMCGLPRRLSCPLKYSRRTSTTTTTCMHLPAGPKDPICAQSIEGQDCWCSGNSEVRYGLHLLSQYKRVTQRGRYRNQLRKAMIYNMLLWFGATYILWLLLLSPSHANERWLYQIVGSDLTDSIWHSRRGVAGISCTLAMPLCMCDLRRRKFIGTLMAGWLWELLGYDWIWGDNFWRLKKFCDFMDGIWSRLSAISECWV